MKPDNKAIYDGNWQSWLDMKVHGPASRWLRTLIHSQIRAVPHPESIQSILDVGCGEGTITHQLARWFPSVDVIGIDFSRSGIQLAQSRYGASNLRYVHDETSRELGRQHDLVTAFEVLEHVEDWQEFLSRIASSARHCVLLSFPTGRMRPFETKMGHYRNFKRGEVEQFMASCGFEIRSVYYAGFPFFSPLYRDLCNVTHSFSESFVEGSYGLRQRVVGSVLFFFFRFLSTRQSHGDQFCGLFCRQQ